MFAFEVKDMSCGHCVSVITKAVKAVDRDATVHIDLAGRRVEIVANAANVVAYGSAIREAGYTPLAVEGTDVRVTGATSAPAGGCCCG